MCHSKLNSIKFCTCTRKISNKKSHWSLKRFKGSSWMDLEQGRCLTPEYSEVQKINSEFIENELNNKSSCFDFEFKAIEGDILNIIFINGKFRTEYEFEFNKKWIKNSSISSHLNTHLVYLNGKLKT